MLAQGIRLPVTLLDSGKSITDDWEVEKLMKLFEKVLTEIPDYKAFLTVDELDESSRQLAEKHPGLVQLKEIGRSRAGKPILMLRIGRGSKKALLFGCPHPNEPIGAMMLEYFAGRLAEDDELREYFDFTWYIIKCIDPDGARLNEGWFKGPFTIENYAMNFFRPASHQQVEWTFPIQYKKLNFNNPIPETLALMAAIDESKPDFLFSLHNAGFGGVYWYMSDPKPELYDGFHRLAEQHQLPLSLGEPEMPYARAFAPAIYKMPSTIDTYDYYEKFTDKDPASIITAGTSSLDYAKKVSPGVFTLVCEVPYFYDPRIDDVSPSDVTRRDAILKTCERDQELYSWALSVFDAVKILLTADSPFKTTVENFLTTGIKSLEAKRRWAESSIPDSKVATVAEEFDNFQVSRFYKLLILGVFRRMLLFQMEVSGKQPQLEKALAEIESKMRLWVDELNKELNYQAIPIRKLIAIQLGSALLSAEQIQRGKTK